MTNTRRPTILVVDDDRALIEVIDLALRTNGIASRSYTDPRIALDEAGMFEWDAALVDVHLRDMDGWQVLSALKGMAPRPVVMMSSAACAEDALPQGADGFLAKPFTIAELLGGLANPGAENLASVQAPRPLNVRRMPDLRERAAWTARHLFTVHGYHGTTMRMLADELNVSVTALYYHYRNKQAIRNRAIQLDLEELVDIILDVVNRRPEPLAAFEGALRVQIRFGLNRRGGVASYWDVRADGEELDPEVERLRARHEEVFAQLLERCAREGLAVVRDSKVMVDAIIRLTEGAGAWPDLGRRLSVSQVEDLYVDLIWSMIGASEPPTAWARVTG